MIFLFKFYRLFFVLISLEFIVINLFYVFSFFLMENYFYFFICFSVISSVTGMLIILYLVKSFGSDKCFF